MSVRDGRRLLVFAFILSLVIHLFAVRYARWSIPSPSDFPENVKITRVAILHRLKRTPPPQTPKPAPSLTPAAQVNARKSVVAPPHTTPRSGRNAVVAAAPVTTPSPTPAPSKLPTPDAGGACVDPNAPAAVRSTPEPPVIPDSARANPKRGVAQVSVGLSERGEVTGAVLDGSTGNSGLDQIAIDFAKAATYTPQLSKCKAVAGSYLFRVKFLSP